VAAWQARQGPFCPPFEKYLSVIAPPLQINAQGSLGPGSQVRVSTINAVLKANNARLWAMTTDVLTGLAAAWDPDLRIASLNSLVKMYRASDQTRHSTVDRTVVPEGVAVAVLGLFEHAQSNVRIAAAMAAGELKLHAAATALQHVLESDTDVMARDAAERALELLSS